MHGHPPADRARRGGDRDRAGHRRRRGAGHRPRTHGDPGSPEPDASASCPPACTQLAPNSDLLVGLNAGDETPAGPRWVSLWTLDDETVTPPDSARLSGAVDVAVQDVCAGVHISHGQLPGHPLVQGIVLAELAATPVFTPRAADCARLS